MAVMNHRENCGVCHQVVCGCPKPTALQSLWGSGDVARDRARRNTAKSMISPPEKATGGQRPQTVYTPQRILDVVAKVWPEGIALDPCSGPDSIVPARRKLDGSPGQDGLAADWESFTYANVPFKYLKTWLAKAVAEAAKGHEIIVLGPVRTHRRWWRHAAVTTAALSFLDPLCFRGYSQAFPAPLFLAYWGARVDTFLEACKSVSKP